VTGLVFAIGFLVGPFACVQLHVLIHELGHAVAGRLVGLRVLSIRVGLLRIGFRRPFVTVAREVRGRHVLGGATSLVPRHVDQVPGAVRTGILGGPIATAALLIALTAALFVWGDPQQGNSFFILGANATYALLMLLGSVTSSRTRRTDAGLLKLLRANDPAFISAYRFAVLTAAAWDCRYKRETGLPLREALDRATSKDAERNWSIPVMAAIYALEERQDEAAVSMLEAVLASDGTRNPGAWLSARTHMLAFQAVVRRDQSAVKQLLARAAPEYRERSDAGPRSRALFTVARLIGEGRVEDARHCFDSIRTTRPETGGALWLEDRVRDLFATPVSDSGAKP